MPLYKVQKWTRLYKRRDNPFAPQVNSKTYQLRKPKIITLLIVIAGYC